MLRQDLVRVEGKRRLGWYLTKGLLLRWMDNLTVQNVKTLHLNGQNGSSRTYVQLIMLF